MQREQACDDEWPEECDGQEPDRVQQPRRVVPRPVAVAPPIRADIQQHHRAGRPDPLSPHKPCQHRGQRIQDRRAHEEHPQGNLGEGRVCVNAVTRHSDDVDAGSFEESDHVHRANPSRPRRLSAPASPQLSPRPATVALTGRNGRIRSRMASSARRVLVHSAARFGHGGAALMCAVRVTGMPLTCPVVDWVCPSRRVGAPGDVLIWVSQ